MNNSQLGSLFRIDTTPCDPSQKKGQAWVHYSLPSFDLQGGPAIEPGSSIESNKTVVSAPSLLVSKLNPRKPRALAVLVDHPRLPQCSSTEFVALKPIGDVSVPFYRHYFGSIIASKWMDCIATGTTNSHVRVRPPELLTRMVPNPPLDEQRRIAAILDASEATIRATEAVIEKLQLEKHGIIESLLPYRANDSGITLAGELNLSEANFDEKILGSLFIDFRAGAAIKSHEFKDYGRPVLAKGDVTFSETIDGTQRSQRVSESAWQQYQASVVDSRFTIISLRDLVPTAPTLGMASQLVGTESYLLAQGAYGAHLDADQIDQAVFIAVTRTTGFRRLMRNLALGSTQVHMRATEYRSLLIPIPTPKYQLTIKKAVTSVSASILAHQTHLNKLRLQHQGLMHDLLTGTVRTHG